MLLTHARASLVEEAAKKDGRSRSGGANSRKRLQARGGRDGGEGGTPMRVTVMGRARVAAHLLP